MARKRDRQDVDDYVPEHTHEFEHEHKRSRKRFALLLALAGGAAYMLRRKQQRAEIDEGVWHEAPSSPS